MNQETLLQDTAGLVPGRFVGATTSQTREHLALMVYSNVPQGIELIKISSHPEMNNKVFHCFTLPREKLLFDRGMLHLDLGMPEMRQATYRAGSQEYKDRMQVYDKAKADYNKAATRGAQ